MMNWWLQMSAFSFPREVVVEVLARLRVDVAADEKNIFQQDYRRRVEHKSEEARPTQSEFHAVR